MEDLLKAPSKFPRSKRRDLLHSVVQKAISRMPGCGVVMTDDEVRAVMEAVPDSELYPLHEEGNVVYLNMSGKSTPD